MIGILKFIQGFLNNNIGVVTFLAGFIAIVLYIKQKKDYERDAAKLILQEVRYAEQQIRNHRINSDSNYYLADKLLPTNSWNKNIHYFIKEIEESEIDLISRFYSHAQYLDNLIDEISKIKGKWWRLPSGIIIIPELKQLQNTTANQQSAENMQQSTSTPLQPPTPQPLPLLSIQSTSLELNAGVILKEVSNKIEFIYNTPAIDKLRKISKKKWYQLL